MSAWTIGNIINICLLPAYGFLLFLNTYNLWGYHIRREYVLLFMSTSFEILGLVLKLTSLKNSLVPFSVQWGLAISNLAFYPLMLACTVALEKWRSLWQRVDNRLQLFKVVYMPLLAFLTGAFACSFLGNIWSNPGDDRVASGLELRKAGAILFSVSVIALFIVVLYAIMRGAVVEQRRDPIIIQILFALPFMLVRNVATAVEAFLSNPNQPYFNPFVDLGFIRMPDLTALVILSILGVTKLRRSDRQQMKSVAYDRRQEVEQARRAGHRETEQPKESLFKRLFKRIAAEEDKAYVAEAPAPTS